MSVQSGSASRVFQKEAVFSVKNNWVNKARVNRAFGL